MRYIIIMIICGLSLTSIVGRATVFTIESPISLQDSNISIYPTDIIGLELQTHAYGTDLFKFIFDDVNQTAISLATMQHFNIEGLSHTGNNLTFYGVVNTTTNIDFYYNTMIPYTVFNIYLNNTFVSSQISTGDGNIFGTLTAYPNYSVNTFLISTTAPAPSPTPSPSPSPSPNPSSSPIPTSSPMPTTSPMPTYGNSTGNYPGNYTGNATGWGEQIGQIVNYIKGISSGISNITSTTSSLTNSINNYNYSKHEPVILKLFAVALPVIPLEIKVEFLFIVVLVGVLLILKR